MELAQIWEKNKKKMMLVIGILLITYLFFRYIFPLISPFICGFILIYWFYPVFYKLEQRYRIKKEYSAVLFMILFVIVMLFIMWGVLQVGIYGVGLLQDNGDKIQEMLQNFIHTSCNLIEEKTGLGKEQIEETIRGGVMHFTESVQNNLISEVMNHGVNYTKKLLPILGFVGVFLIATLLICKEFEDVMEKVKKIGILDNFMNFMERLLTTIFIYVKAQICILTLIGLISGFTLWAMGISNGFLLGIFVGLMDALPFIGTGIILIPTAIWQFFNGNTGVAVGCIVLYGVCVIVREWLEPRLMGKNLGISPLLILLALYAGVQLFGMSGIIKGPLVVVLLKEVYGTLNHYEV